MITTEFLLQILGPAVGGIAAYVAIRSDLAVLRARLDNMEKHLMIHDSRINTLYDRHRTRSLT